MTTTPETRRINTHIQSVGKQRNSDGWMLVLEYKLPGSTYETTLYGKDWATIEGWKPSDPVLAVIKRGNPKAGKDASKEYNFFWDLVELLPPGPQRDSSAQDDQDTPPWEEAPPAATPGASATTPGAGREAPPPLPQALGACQNHAMAFIESGIIPVPEGRDPINFLWELRDLIYRGVNQKPYQAPGFCYQHEVPFDRKERSDRAARFHLMGGGWCVEHHGFIAKEA